VWQHGERQVIGADALARGDLVDEVLGKLVDAPDGAC